MTVSHFSTANDVLASFSCKVAADFRLFHTAVAVTRDIWVQFPANISFFFIFVVGFYLQPIASFILLLFLEGALAASVYRVLFSES